jgi:hypothetical protein
MPTPIESMRLVAQKLNSLDVSFAFLGGCAVSLLVDRPELTDVRPTEDVDVIVEIATLDELYKLEEILRAAEFQHDTSEGAPICRWILKGCRVDIMPIDSRPLGMNSRWFREALESARPVALGQNVEAKVVTRPFFVATKLAAFQDRGHSDLYGSRDVEDIVTVVEGSGSIIEEIAKASPDLRRFIAKGFSNLIEHADFDEALFGHLSAMFGARERLDEIKQKFVEIAELG